MDTRKAQHHQFIFTVVLCLLTAVALAASIALHVGGAANSAGAVASGIVTNPSASGPGACIDPTKLTPETAVCTTITGYGGAPLVPRAPRTMHVDLHNNGSLPGTLQLDPGPCRIRGGLPLGSDSLCHESRIRLICPERIIAFTPARGAVAAPYTLATMLPGSSLRCEVTITASSNSTATISAQDLTQRMRWILRAG